NVTSKLIDPKLQDSLASHIKGKLADELAEASKHIANGDYSQEEIKQFQKKIKEKAFVEAKVWREDYRKKEQVEITETTVTQWYETRLGPQLKNEFKALVDGQHHGWGG